MYIYLQKKGDPQRTDATFMIDLPFFLHQTADCLSQKASNLLPFLSQPSSLALLAWGITRNAPEPVADQIGIEATRKESSKA